MTSALQTAKPARRVLLIGLDGATWTNMQPWAEQGVMPTLKKLMAEGAWGILNSSIPALTPPAWASLVTGTNPGKHGVYHFRHNPINEYYQRRLINSRDVHSPTVWQRLNQHGKRAGVLNIPFTYPVQAMDGFIAADPFAPDGGGVATYPPELAADFRDFVADVHNYPTVPPGGHGYADGLLAFLDENEKVLVLQADAAVRLMKSQRWDFFMLGWMINDRLHHFSWKFSDPAQAASFNTEEQKKIAARCRALFAQLDTQFARVIEAAGQDCSVVVASDHGGGPAPKAFFHTNRWLIEHRYLKLLPPWHWQRLLVGYLPRSWKNYLRTPIDSKHGLVDWAHTQVWADPLESRATGIRINRTGRYPGGIVSEANWQTLRDRLIKELSEIRSPDGETVFAEIHPAEHLYHGPFAAAGPDLVAILSKSYDVPASFRRDVRSTATITPNHHFLRDGGHEPEGIVLLWGANIRRATRLPPQPIESITPTVLELFGLPIGDDIDAEPITAAINEDFLRAHPPRRASAPAPVAPTAQPEYSDQDSAKVEERLRNLGYLD